jgi:hypothetical protein
MAQTHQPPAERVNFGTLHSYESLNGFYQTYTEHRGQETGIPAA